MRPTRSVIGVILAGGTSRRFGEDKARFLIGGVPMIKRVHGVLSPVVDAVVISGVPRPDILPGAVWIGDEYHDAGPLSGLHAAMSDKDAAWYLVLACDMPYLTEDVVSAILSKRDSYTQAVVTRTPDGRLHPLCACYRRALLPSIESRLDVRQLSMVGFLDEITELRIVDVQHRPLTNVNRKSDIGPEPVGASAETLAAGS